MRLKLLTNKHFIDLIQSKSNEIIYIEFNLGIDFFWGENFIT